MDSARALLGSPERVLPAPRADGDGEVTPLVQATLAAGYFAMVLLAAWVFLTAAHKRQEAVRRALSHDPTMSESGARALMAFLILWTALAWPVSLPVLGWNLRKKGKIRS